MSNSAATAGRRMIMRYVRECAIIFGITLVGEGLNLILPLPVPSGVYGLFLLLFLLCTKAVKLEDVEATGNFLLDIMPILFIPASVGLIESYKALRGILVPLVVICIVSTLAVMVVTGKMAEFMLSIGGRKRTSAEKEEERQA